MSAVGQVVREGPAFSPSRNCRTREHVELQAKGSAKCDPPKYVTYIIRVVDNTSMNVLQNKLPVDRGSIRVYAHCVRMIWTESAIVRVMCVAY